MNTYYRNGLVITIYAGNPLVGPHGCTVNVNHAAPVRSFPKDTSTAFKVVAEWAMACELGNKTAASLSEALDLRVGEDGIIRAVLMDTPIVQYGTIDTVRNRHGKHKGDTHSFSFINLISGKPIPTPKEPETPHETIQTTHLETADNLSVDDITGDIE